MSHRYNYYSILIGSLFFLLKIFCVSSEIEKEYLVDVLICVEALCPDCQDYFVSQVNPIKNLLENTDVVNLTLVPFGNADINFHDETVTCQHGLGECDANSWEQCIINVLNPFDYLNMIECLEEKFPTGYRDVPIDVDVIANCAELNSVDFHSIQDCYLDSYKVWELNLQAYLETPLYHDHVPWVEINGKHIDEEVDSLLSKICDAYVVSSDGLLPKECPRVDITTSGSGLTMSY